MRSVPAVGARWGAAIRNLANPTTLVALLLVAILIFLVANPLFQLVKASFTRASDHSFTLANYVTAFGRPRYVQALVNSIELGAVAAAIASLIAVPLAWGISRTDMPARGFVNVMVLASFLIPPFVGAIGWILLGGPNAGWINQAVDGGDRRRPHGSVQYLLVLGIDAGHRAVFVPADLSSSPNPRST